MSKTKEFNLVKATLLEQKKSGKKLDKVLLEKYKSLKSSILIEKIEKETGKTVVLTEAVKETKRLIESLEKISGQKVLLKEAAGSLAGLPTHWTKYLTQPSWLGSGGENSEKIKQNFKFSDKSKMLAALKNENNIAVMMYEGSTPVFMICKHPSFENKFKLFTQKPGNAWDKNVGERVGRNFRTSKMEDSFTLSDIAQKFNADDLPNWNVYTLTKDQERIDKSKERRDSKGGDQLAMKQIQGKGVNIAPAYKKVKEDADKKVSKIAFDYAKRISDAAELFKDETSAYKVSEEFTKIANELSALGQKLKDLKYSSDSGSFSGTTKDKYYIDKYKSLKALVNSL